MSPDRAMDKRYRKLDGYIIMKEIDCKHWRQCENTQGGCCEIDQFPGPSYGTCILACPIYEGSQDIYDFIGHPPTRWQKIKTAVRAALRALWALIRDWKIRVTKKVFAERQAICLKCEYLNLTTNKCDKCGCGYPCKLKIGTESCPLTPPKWEAVQ